MIQWAIGRAPARDEWTNTLLMRISIPLLRAAYRCVYLLLRIYWFIVRPQVRGVICLLVHENHFLLIRNTYSRQSWTMPGA